MHAPQTSVHLHVSIHLQGNEIPQIFYHRKCQGHPANQGLRECVVRKGDGRILPETMQQGHLIVAEVHDHVSCYRNYTRVKAKGQEDLDQDVHEDGTDQRRIQKTSNGGGGATGGGRNGGGGALDRIRY